MSEIVVYNPYETVPFENFYEELFLNCEGLTADIANHYIRNTAIEFTEKSQVIIEKTTIELEPNTEEYILPIFNGLNATSLLEAFLNGRKVQIARRSQGNTHCTSPVNVTLVLPDELYVNNAPSGRNNLDLTIAYSVKQDADELPIILYRKYRNAIIAGTLYNLMLTKPFQGTLGLIGIHKDTYEKAITAASIDRIVGTTRGSFRRAISKVV